MNLNVSTVITGPFQENTYIAWYPSSQDALLVDPGDDEYLIIEALEERSLVPIAIINTHAHLDHIGAVQPLKEKYNIPFYLHKNEKSILESYESTCHMFGVAPKTTPSVEYWFKDEGLIKINNFHINIVCTPGHTPGGTCLEIENNIFVGDTLFKNSIGRTDLPGGDWNELQSSLIHLANSVNCGNIVYSGHGPVTTLRAEISENPFFIPLKESLNLDI